MLMVVEGDECDSSENFDDDGLEKQRMRAREFGKVEKLTIWNDSAIVDFFINWHFSNNGCCD